MSTAESVWTDEEYVNRDFRGCAVVSQRDYVFHGQCRALPERGPHRVGGVADQHHPAVDELAGRTDLENFQGDHLGGCRGDQLRQLHALCRLSVPAGKLHLERTRGQA